MNRKINFAVVGYGHIGKRHAKIIQEHPDCQLIAVCDIDESQKKSLLSDISYYINLQDLLEQENEVDVICICTPNHLHAIQSMAVIEAGAHVVCEKPMGLTKSECESMIYSALNQDRKIFCVMQNRYSPPAQWIKSVIEKQLLGEIFFVHVDCFWNRDQRYYLPDGQKHLWKGKLEKDGGTLFTQFSHFIDMLYWLFGDLKNINARFYNFNHEGLTDFEDSGSIQFDFIKGGAGCLNYSTSVWDSNFESSLTILGSKGTVKIGGQYMNEVAYCNIQDYEMPELKAVNPPNDYGNYKGSAANHHFIIQNVVDTLKNKKTVTTNALEGLKVVEIIERIYQQK